MLGFAAIDLIKNEYLHQNPKLIKIDFDGIEHLIIEAVEDILN